MPDANKLFGGGNSTNSDSNKPEAEITDKESTELSGEAGKGLTPAFGKHGGGEDENNPITSEQELEDVKKGSAENSGTPGVDTDAILAAGALGEAPEDGSVEYIAPSIPRLRIGKFQFEGGVLNLKGEDVEKFEKLLDGAHNRTRQAVSKIDRAKGDAVARKFLETRSTRGVSTSEDGERSPAPSES